MADLDAADELLPLLSPVAAAQRRMGAAEYACEGAERERERARIALQAALLAEHRRTHPTPEPST